MKKLGLVLIVGIIVATAIVLFVTKDNKPDDSNQKADDDRQPLDVTLEFYERWLTAVKSTNTDPFVENLHNDAILSANIVDFLSGYREDNPDATLDPVLCQETAPRGLRTLTIYEQNEAAKYLIMSSEKGITGQATVTIEKVDGFWQITDIVCGMAEADPNQGEYSFDREGHLLKNVPAPLDSNYWHLVFEENGVKGHTAPLFFSENSICVQDGAESICDESQFTGAMPAHVQGEMTEAGVDVVRIEL